MKNKKIKCTRCGKIMKPSDWFYYLSEDDGGEYRKAVCRVCGIGGTDGR